MRQNVFSIALIFLAGAYGAAFAEDQIPQQTPPIYNASQATTSGALKPAVPDQRTDVGPKYPYPPYHNPYYDNSASKDPLNAAVDWLKRLPHSIVDRVVGFVDNRFYPSVPATSGGAPGAPICETKEPRSGAGEAPRL